jgi:hemerythrin-like domain-containing protein
MTAIETLKHEHQIVLLVLAGAERETQSIRKTGKADTAKIETMLDFFKNFVDRCHHTKEEKHLFPKMLERGLPKEGGPITVMLYEHDQGRARVRAVAAALPEAKKGNASAAAAVRDDLSSYIELLRAHIDKENNVLFPMAEQILSPEDMRQLSAAFEKVEAEEIGEGVHEKYHHLAHELAEG